MSLLPRGQPQGKFVATIPSDATVEDLLQQLCRDTGTVYRSGFCLRNRNLDLLKLTDSLTESGVQDGTFLHWTNESEHITTRQCLKQSSNIYCWSLVIILVGIVGIVSVCVIYIQDLGPDLNFAIVFDAGPDHTSMLTYSWEGTHFNGTSRLTQFGHECKTLDKGMSSFELDPQEAGKSLQACLDMATHTIPAYKHGRTPVYLGATADMRLLQIRNPNASKAILESVRQTFTDSHFSFTNPAESVRIIDGSEEGVFTWITSNYITEFLNMKHPETQDLSSTKFSSKVGTLEMGGSSTQITFAPPSGTAMPASYTHAVEVFGKRYDVYTYSYLCYGAKDFHQMVYAQAVRENRNRRKIEIPCLPLGYSIVKNYSELFGTTCTPDVPFIKKNSSFVFYGSSKSFACSELVRRTLFNRTCDHKYPTEGLNCHYQPIINGPFIAMSTFVYTLEFMNVTNSSSTWCEHSDYVKATQKICHLSWAELQQVQLRRPADRGVLMYKCMRAHYISQLLREGFGFIDSLWRKIHFLEAVGSTEVTFTLGLLLTQRTHFPAHIQESRLSYATFIILTVLFSAAILAGVALASQRCWLKNAGLNMKVLQQDYGIKHSIKQKLANLC